MPFRGRLRAHRSRTSRLSIGPSGCFPDPPGFAQRQDEQGNRAPHHQPGCGQGQRQRSQENQTRLLGNRKQTPLPPGQRPGRRSLAGEKPQRRTGSGNVPPRCRQLCHSLAPRKKEDPQTHLDPQLPGAPQRRQSPPRLRPRHLQGPNRMEELEKISPRISPSQRDFD